MNIKNTVRFQQSTINNPKS